MKIPRAFGVPENVVRDRRLGKEDRVLILESWALDLAALARAEDENMPGAGAGSPGVELLQRVTDARRALLAEEPLPPPA